MHTICMTISSDFNTEARLAAAHAKKHGLTQEQIAEALGASQSQVSRILSGASKRRSRLLNEVCKYVFSVQETQAVRVEDCQELMAAIEEVWDGTPIHARALATVIRSLGLLQGVDRGRT